MVSFTVSVPATTANIGPGFDCLGAALGLYNHVTVTSPTDPTTDLLIEARGRDGQKISAGKDNLLYQAIAYFYQQTGQAIPPLKLEIDLEIPLARGLGSSATAIVGGLLAANQVAGNPCTKMEILQMAIAMEGHPDNVAPALLGGCQLAVKNGQVWELIALDWPSKFVPVLAIPDFELSTEAARAVLPQQYDRSAAIFNASHLALLVQAFSQGRGDWLALALQDQIHQPYRQGLIPAYDQLHQAALNAGAYNLVISGAGPTLLAIADEVRAPQVASTLVETWHNAGITAESHCLPIDIQGATITKLRNN
ncbi:MULTISPECIES: homoserine kinase [unclassified Synechocystis]|uniref:homoserine kinase n=1 Tax=unclassified Synechocystis TaxID=2640012 RepID=UPI0003F56DAB|nr:MULTISPECIES: homoserine kinase [unclassified Synechocystis]AIE74945.1 Homoserine kinase [Synechocystis sp. PCC 6714]MCT0253343.1 homoserine kinase [Synechocystis sp. CS-94]